MSVLQGLQDTTQFPFGAVVARGNPYNGMRGIHKYGYNASSNDGSYEIVWEQGGSITYPTTAAVASINSASSNSGVVITVEGLDANYALATDTITLDGSGDGSTTTTFTRINRAFVSGSTALSADADITIGGNVQAHVDSDHNQTLQCLYTVPAGHNAYLIDLGGGVEEKDKEATIRIYAREDGGVFRTRDLVSFQTNHFDKEYKIPLHFGPKTDIQIQAKVNGATTGVSASFDILLEAI